MRLSWLLPPRKAMTRRSWITTFVFDAVIGLVFFGAIQLVPAIPHNPPVEREPVWDSPETRAMAAQACFNCHSNETQWPWFARIAPVSWVLAYDVTQGRKALDFSEWDRFAVSRIDPNDPFPPKSLTERIADEIANNRMPPGLYRINHPEARLSPAQKQALIDGLVRTVQQNQLPFGSSTPTPAP